MNEIKEAIRSMIMVTEEELSAFLGQCSLRTYRKREIVDGSGTVPNEIFFIKRGIIRVIIADQNGTEHTVHFALEGQFFAEYSSFLTCSPSMYTLQALEETEVVVMPRAAIEWGYTHMKQGDKLGRLIAEYYFIYQDHRIKNMYARSPKERYDTITEVFPHIHDRVPQHMIASYLGITPVHLSRLKKQSYRKT